MCGRRFRMFNVFDNFNREALAIEIDLSLPAPRVIRVLERVSLQRGYPEKLRVDGTTVVHRDVFCLADLDCIAIHISWVFLGTVGLVKDDLFMAFKDVEICEPTSIIR